MPARILHDELDRKAWLTFLAAQPLPCTVSYTKGARRSLPQNSLAAKWYSQIAAEVGDTPAAVKAMCKLRYGVPIMEADRPDWVAKWSPLYAPLPYAMKLVLFEAIPLTSLLTTRQMASYLDAVQRDYLAQGVALVDPDARRYEAEMGR